MFRNRDASTVPTRPTRSKSHGTAAPLKDAQICSICRDNVNAKHAATIDCSHAFHLECIRQWIDAENHSCPNCRASVTFTKCGWRKVSTKRKPKKPSQSFVAKLVGWFTEVHGEPKHFI